jgi:hypothetical protein
LLPHFSDLGELQMYYGSFLKDLSDLNNYVTNDFYGSKIASLSEEINGILEFITRLSTKEMMYSENQKIEERKYQRDSSLSVDKVIPLSELEMSHQSLLRVKNRTPAGTTRPFSKNPLSWMKKRQLLQDYRITRTDEKEKACFSSA